MTGKAEMYQSNYCAELNGSQTSTASRHLALPAALWLTRPLTSAEARSLVGNPAAIRDVVAVVMRALAECQQEIIEREQCEGVKS